MNLLFKCTPCSRTFRNKSALDRHLKTHFKLPKKREQFRWLYERKYETAGKLTKADILTIGRLIDEDAPTMGKLWEFCGFRTGSGDGWETGPDQ